MSSRRSLILLGAITTGLVAAFLLFGYVDGLEADIKKDIETVPVLKADRLIPRGTLGEQAAQDLLSEGEINREFLPDSRVSNTDELTGQIALFDIPAGVPITQGMFVSRDAIQVSFRQRLTNPEWVTVTVSVGGMTAVGDNLTPGDEVNMMLKIEPEEDTPAAGEGYVFDSWYEMLYQNVHILAINTSTELQPGEDPPVAGTIAAGSGLVTFNVPMDAARLIASAVSNGEIYLSLIPEDFEPVALPEFEPILDSLPGQVPAELTPYGGPDGQGVEE